MMRLLDPGGVFISGRQFLRMAARRGARVGWGYHIGDHHPPHSERL